jgi:hypothetical protein
MSMVTAPEAAALLALASSFDNRTQNSAATRAWAEALSDVDFQDAQTAIVEHYKTESRWIMPADVRNGVRNIQRERAAAAPDVYELEPPTWVTELEGEEFDAAYLVWIKDNSERARKGLPLEAGPTPVPVARQLVS